ncbi:hypothetical protein Glove_196g133 [Diversispora epigaea]|uniref:Uncharacterized protein n=1 Tax=Diversispora epigaea TaxID=1348612 RepID=A0A397IUA5_9GLOM|nr:hypothetical protein Glove_196g133 [Diversispora epigaea]
MAENVPKSLETIKIRIIYKGSWILSGVAKGKKEIKRLLTLNGTKQSRPIPIVSNHTNLTSERLIPLPSNSSNPNWLSIINIRKELDQRNIIYNDDKENQIDLANKLQKNIQQETINKINETKIQHKSYKQVYEDKIFTMEIQKGNQEYGKKGGGKLMTEAVKELLKIFFHMGEENKSEIYTTKDMHQELLH